MPWSSVEGEKASNGPRSSFRISPAEFITNTVSATIEKHLAFSLNAVGDPMHRA